MRFDQAVALLIVPDALRVLATIELNDNLRFQARKIRDETSNRHLSPEPLAGKLSAPKILPKVSLSIRCSIS